MADHAAQLHAIVLIAARGVRREITPEAAIAAIAEVIHGDPPPAPEGGGDERR